MKPLAMASVIVLAGLSGCATPAWSPHADTRPETSTSSPQDSTKQTSVRKLEAKSVSGTSTESQLPAAEPNDTSVAPDSVIKLDPKSGKLTSEMEVRLLKVAEAAKQDARIFLRLEAYVPDGGSPALSIGVADRTLQIVGDRLVALGVSARRIVKASFGQEHDGNRELHRHWVEIYIVK